MKRILYLKSIIALFIFISSISFGFSEIHRFDWGSKQSDLGIRSEACGRYGPSDFHVEKGYLYLLDRENSIIKLLDKDSRTIKTHFHVDNYTDCFTVKDGYIAFYNGIEIKLFMDKTHREPVIIKKPENVLIIKDLLIHNNMLYIMNEKGWYNTLYDIKNKRESYTGVNLKAIYQDKRFINAFLIRTGFHILDIFIGSTEISLEYEGYLGASKILYIEDDFILLKSEELLSFNPISAREMLLFIDYQGNIIKRMDIPFHYYTYIPDNIKILDNYIYFLLSAEEGLYVYNEPLSDIKDIKEDSLQKIKEDEYHYNHDLLKEPETDLNLKSRPKSEDPITRTQILENGTPYESLIWTASSSNISDGIIQLPDSSYIRTPAWVTVGSKQKVPYKWGGWTALNTFTEGIPAGKYAGDNYTSSVSWTDNYCIGVDCSGFVSRAWNTSTKYGTSTLPNISTAYSGFTELKRGDIVNNAGSHVRLVINDNPSGTVNTIEAAGADWRVSYRDFTFTQLSDYIPRYFNWVIDDEDPSIPDVPVMVKDWVYTLNIRSGPSSSHSILTTVTGNQKFIACAYQEGWYKLHFPSGEGYSYGWCNGGTTTENGYLTGSQETDMVTVDVSSTLNVRSGPSTGYPVITTVSNGQKFAVLDSSGGWYKFSLPESTGYEEGWASGSYLILTYGGSKSPVGAELISLNAPSSLEVNHDGSVDIVIQNIGSSSLSPTTKLKTTNPYNHNSPLFHSTWVSQNTVKAFNVQVLPFQEHSFSFLINPDQSIAGQNYTQYLNLYEDGIGWFSGENELGPDDDTINFSVDIQHTEVDITSIGPTSGTYDIGSQLIITWNCSAPAGDSMRISIKRDGYPDVPGPDYYLLTSDTPNSGSASFAVPEGINTADDWRVWVAHNPSGSFSNSAGCITIKQPVAVYISDGSSAIEGAKIIIDSTELFTNSQGYAYISLFHNNYSVHVNAEGYIYYDGSHTIGQGSANISITLQPSVYNNMAVSFQNPSFRGTWLWSWTESKGSSWTEIVPEITARKMEAGDISGNGVLEIIADFGDHGLWYYSFSSHSWFNLGNYEMYDFALAKAGTENIMTIIASFAEYGLYRYDFSVPKWIRIIEYPALIIASGNISQNPDNTHKLALSFRDANGLYTYDFQSGTFTRIIFVSPSQIITADITGDGFHEMICVFNGFGVYFADYSSKSGYQWNRITWGTPDEGHLISHGDIAYSSGSEIFITYQGSTYYYTYDTGTWTELITAPFKRIISGKFTGQARDDLILCESTSGDVYLRKTYFSNFELLSAGGDASSMCRTE